MPLDLRFNYIIQVQCFQTFLFPSVTRKVYLESIVSHLRLRCVLQSFRSWISRSKELQDEINTTEYYLRVATNSVQSMIANFNIQVLLCKHSLLLLICQGTTTLNRSLHFWQVKYPAFEDSFLRYQGKSLISFRR